MPRYQQATERSVRLPVKWIDNELRRADGTELPAFKADALIELVFPVDALANPADQQRFLERITHKIADRIPLLCSALAPRTSRLV